jgi:hypothetical protein
VFEALLGTSRIAVKVLDAGDPSARHEANVVSALAALCGSCTAR